MATRNSRYEGERNSRGQKHGFGIMYYADGCIYKGEWKCDKQHGMGEFDWRDGNVYIGQFKDGKQEGFGLYKWPTGGSYLGLWRDDRMCGHGTYRRNDNVMYIGEWKDDHQMGEGLRVHPERVASGKDRKFERKRIVRERWNGEKVCYYTKELEVYPDMWAIHQQKQAKFADTDIVFGDEVDVDSYESAEVADLEDVVMSEKYYSQPVDPEPTMMDDPAFSMSAPSSRKGLVSIETPETASGMRRRVVTNFAAIQQRILAQALYAGNHVQRVEIFGLDKRSVYDEDDFHEDEEEEDETAGSGDEDEDEELEDAEEEPGDAMEDDDSVVMMAPGAPSSSSSRSSGGAARFSPGAPTVAAASILKRDLPSTSSIPGHGAAASSSSSSRASSSSAGASSSSSSSSQRRIIRRRNSPSRPSTSSGSRQ